MFTLDQILSAHSKVKSGADFPAYIQDIKQLGVIFYETHVSDGHTDYHGANRFQVSAPATYPPMMIADIPNADLFKAELKAHQQGKTDFPTFVRMCAAFGIEKWVVRVDKMTCTYVDKDGNVMWVEAIPKS
jgi:uncharacterized protein YbcV (DUF1398 family)